MSVGIKEQRPIVILPQNKLGDGVLAPEGDTAQIVTEGQVNTAIAAMELEARKIMLDAGQPSSEKPNQEPELSEKAELSEAAKDREVTPEQRLRFMLEWTLEQLGEEWLFLLNFIPSPGQDLGEILEQLYTLYHFLEAAIMSNTSGTAMQREMTRLDQAFSMALNKVWQSSMAEILKFFETYGTKSQVQWLKSGVHYLATGEKLSPRALERFWQAGRDVQKPGSNADTGGSNYQAFTRKGVLYQNKGREITFIPHEEVPLSGRPASTEAKTGVEQSQQGLQGQQSRLSLRNASEQIKTGNFLAPEKQGLFSGSDLQKADSFIKYFVKEGSVFTQPYFNSKHEELMGVLSAVTAMKCREFCLSSKLGAKMGSELQTAVDGYIDKTIRQNSYIVRDGGEQPELQQKEIYRTYYYTMNQYQKYGKADKAIFEGLKYAVEVFQDKKINEIFSQQQRYGREAEFFHTGSWNIVGQMERLAADLRQGAALLEQDWGNFLKYMGKSHEKVMPFAAMMLARRPQQTFDDEREEDPKGEQKDYRFFIISGISLTLMLLIFIWIVLY